MRKSKYPSIGIMDALERLLHGQSSSSVWNNDWYDRAKREYPDLSKSRFKHLTFHLDRRGHIRLIKDKSSTKLTNQGSRALRLKKAREWKIDTFKQEGVYRLIVFDIPETKRSARNILRAKLKQHKCRKLQKSVYITPFACEKSIALLGDILDVRKNIDVLKVVKEKSVKFDDRQKKHIYFYIIGFVIAFLYGSGKSNTFDRFDKLTAGKPSVYDMSKLSRYARSHEGGKKHYE